MDLQSRRVYEPPAADDGIRILVDRLWPRGVSKEQAKIDDWLKEIAPSQDLRRWFGHDRTRWPEFKRRYFQELAEKRELVDALLARAAKEKLTFLYAARDEQCNNAVALVEYLRNIEE